MDGTRRRNRARGSNRRSVRTRSYRGSCTTRTSIACPTTTSSPPKPSQSQQGYLRFEKQKVPCQRSIRASARRKRRAERKRNAMLKKEDSIAPHGGQLVDRTVPAEERDERLREAAELPKVTLGSRTVSDLQMISTGVFSPLEGFMLQEEYESVVEEMRLLDGLVWSLPVTLATDKETARTLNEGSEVALTNGSG